MGDVDFKPHLYHEQVNDVQKVNIKRVQYNENPGSLTAYVFYFAEIAYLHAIKKCIFYAKIAFWYI